MSLSIWCNLSSSFVFVVVAVAICATNSVSAISILKSETSSSADIVVYNTCENAQLTIRPQTVSGEAAK